MTEISNGFLITWQPPPERNHLIQYYTIKYKTDGPWKTLNKGQIRPEETSYLGTFLSVAFLFLSVAIIRKIVGVIKQGNWRFSVAWHLGECSEESGRW